MTYVAATAMAALQLLRLVLLRERGTIERRQVVCRRVALRFVPGGVQEAYAGMALDSFFKNILSQLGSGLSRRNGLWRAAPPQLCTGCWAGVPAAVNWIDPRLLAILETAVYQLWFLSGSPEYAVVHEAVELARQGGHAGTAGFVNGVLRELLRQRWQISYPDPKEDPAGHLSLAGSHPRWLVERWLGRWGFRVQRLCALNNQPARGYTRQHFADRWCG